MQDPAEGHAGDPQARCDLTGHTVSVGLGGEDVAAFVAARWAEVEAVALFATLDPARARSLTADAFSAVRRRWSDVWERGAPTDAVRRELVRRLPEGELLARSTRGSDALEVLEGCDDEFRAALLAALAVESPRVRAALAADVVWGVGPDGFAALAAPQGMWRGRSSRGGVAVAAEVAAARHRLARAHRAAAREGVQARGWRFEHDLVAAIESWTARTAPAPEVAFADGLGAAPRPGRRVLLIGGAAVALTGAGSGWLVWRRSAEHTTLPKPTPTAPAPSAPGPTDPVWASTRTWPAHGALVDDFDIQALAARGSVDASGANRLLYADDIDGARVVITAPLDQVGPDATLLRAWTGPEGQRAGDLSEVALGTPGIFGAADVVALSVPHRETAGLLLALTSPTDGALEISTTTSPTRAGTVARSWQRHRVQHGLIALPLTTRPGVATRIRIGDYDGLLPRPRAWDDVLYAEPPDADDPFATVLPQVADATGIPAAKLRTRLLTAPLPAHTPIPDWGGDGPADLARLLHVITPQGAVIRMTSIGSTRTPGSPGMSDGLFVIPADAIDTPSIQRLYDDQDPHLVTYIVLIPGPGATVQLSGTTPENDAPSDAALVHHHLAVLTRREDPATQTDVKVTVRDSQGQVLHDDVPAPRRDLYGLIPEDTLALGPS